jgi:hypothetical protein
MFVKVPVNGFHYNTGKRNIEKKMWFSELSIKADL